MMKQIDFSRSFIQFTTAGVNHTPRLQVDAVCRIGDGEGGHDLFALAAACICEQMYVPENLVHRPPAEFLFMANHNDQFLLLKTGARSERTVREAHRVGERMTTHDGRGGLMKQVELHLAAPRETHPLESYEEVREAILSNRVLNARTAFTTPDGREAELLYPVKVCNVAHEQPLWQIDTGRILFPAHPPGEGLPIECFEPAYLVYHARDWIEAAILHRDPSGPCGPDYSDIRRIDARNDLYLLMI